MKKYIITAMILFLGTALFAQAPELKNMIPNSWQKLTRLSEQEEKEFFEKDEVQEAILSIDNFFRKRKLKKCTIRSLRRQIADYSFTDF